jgi:hypothetical protein
MKPEGSTPLYKKVALSLASYRTYSKVPSNIDITSPFINKSMLKLKKRTWHL